MPGEAILVQEEDVRGRHTHVPRVDLAPLEPDLSLVGFVSEDAEGLVLTAGDDDRVVAVLCSDLFKRLFEVHICPLAVCSARAAFSFSRVATTGCGRWLRGARPSPTAPPPHRGAQRPRGCAGCLRGRSPTARQ